VGKEEREGGREKEGRTERGKEEGGRERELYF
jgi:hypothetical protein